MIACFRPHRSSVAVDVAAIRPSAAAAAAAVFVVVMVAAVATVVEENKPDFAGFVAVVEVGAAAIKVAPFVARASAPSHHEVSPSHKHTMSLSLSLPLSIAYSPFAFNAIRPTHFQAPLRSAFTNAIALYTGASHSPYVYGYTSAFPGFPPLFLCSLHAPI